MVYSTDTQLGTWDIVVVVAYFCFVFAVGIFSMCRSNRSNVGGYFLAGRSMNWWLVGLSLFASNIGSEHFIGLAGNGAAGGLATYLFEINAIFCLVMLGWVFLPVYIACGVSTMPEYLNKRFGRQRLRVCLTAYALLLYVFVKVSVDLFAGAIFIQQALRWNLYVSIIFILGVTALFTMAGGLTAVMYTDALQSFIMVAGAIVLSVLSFIEIGSYSNLKEKYMDAMPNITRYTNYTCGTPRDDAFNMVRDPVDSDWPFPGLLFRSTVISLWNWCADQIIVQRVLAAKTIPHARGGSVLASYLKILPLFLMMFPGMISRALWPEEIACADPETCLAVCDNELSCSNIAYPKLILELMPEGLRGLMMAVMLSALMSSLTSIFNSASTVFTLDVWKRLRKDAKQRELMIVGRVFVLVLAAIGILWIPVMMSQGGGQLMEYIWAITSYLAAPITALFLCAVFFPRANEQGSFWGLVTGMVIGLTRMVLSFIFPSPACWEEDTRPSWLSFLHHSYFSMALFIFCVILIVIVSLMTDPLPEYKIVGTTFFTRDEIYQPEDEVSEDGNAGVFENEMTKSHPDSFKTGKSYSMELHEIKTDIKAEVKTVDDDVTDDRNQSPLKRAFGWICGLSGSEADNEDSAKITEEQIEKLRATNTKPVWKYFLNINVVLLFAVEIGIIVYFR
ncbi:sodium/glucose cotransporter 4-like [Glandiceps talaboti]